ncbi:hypothetical protein BJ741DRAFT_626991 [Chytriomyces cf. hyalinus JEL632]|nr:hypothetical protein BJ741DRAFT_626991 [Chytriomyces cf. hyalinus JEL632]
MNSSLYSPVSDTAAATKMLPIEDDKLPCLPPPKLAANISSMGTFPILPIIAHTIQMSITTRVTPTPSLAAELLSDTSSENESWFHSEADVHNNAAEMKSTHHIDKNAVRLSVAAYQLAIDALQPCSYLVSNVAASHMGKRQKQHQLPKPVSCKPPKSCNLAISLPKVAVDEFPEISSLCNISMQCFSCPRIPNIMQSQFHSYSMLLATFLTVQTLSCLQATSACCTRSEFNYDAACKTAPLFKTSFSVFGLKGMKITCQPVSPTIQDAVAIYLLGICNTGNSKGQFSAGFFHGSSKLFDLVAQWFMLGFGVEMPHTSIPAHAMEELLKTHCFMNQGSQASAVTVTLKGCNSRKIRLGLQEMQELSCRCVHISCSRIYYHANMCDDRLNETDSCIAFYHGCSFSMMQWLQGLAGASDLSLVTEISSSTFSITASGKIIFSQCLSACMLKILLSFLSKC